MRNNLRVILIDDERLARQELRSLLAEHAEVQVLAEAENITEAADLIEQHEPDLIFLDIQLRGESGFDLLEEVDGDFKIIFVTAFDAYAIRAFEVNALDYLLKPVNPLRLAKALTRLNDLRPHPSKAPLDYDDRLFLDVDNERSRFLKICTITYIKGAGDYSEVFTTSGRRVLTSKPLKEWEERLPSKYFSRIHRSSIVNLECIDKIEPWFNRSYRVTLRNIAKPLTMSRRYAAQIKAKFG